MSTGQRIREWYNREPIDLDALDGVGSSVRRVPAAELVVGDVVTAPGFGPDAAVTRVSLEGGRVFLAARVVDDAARAGEPWAENADDEWDTDAAELVTVVRPAETVAAALTITHTPEAGTLVAGTARGDGSAEVLKANGWRWGRSIGAWFVPSSRDHLPNRWKIDRTAEALRAAGFVVTLELDTGHRATADVEADKIVRQAARVDALEAKAERREAEADAAYARARAIAEPMTGEPIHVGHHSERRQRADIAKLDRAMRRSIDATDEATEAARRAEVAGHTTSSRYSPVTVGNRIKKLEAELRGIDRKATEPWWHRTTAEGEERETFRRPNEEERARIVAANADRRAYLADQLAYWQGIRAEQVENGRASDAGPDTVHVGDEVRTRFGWRRVVRVNKTSVSVETDYSWTDRVAWHEVFGYRTPASATS